MNEYELLTFVVLAKTTTLVLGGLVATLAYRASRRQSSTTLRAFALGFGLVTVGVGVVGVLTLVTDGLHPGVLVESVVTTIGFGVLWYSLYAEEARPTRT